MVTAYAICIIVVQNPYNFTGNNITNESGGLRFASGINESLSGTARISIVTSSSCALTTSSAYSKLQGYGSWWIRFKASYS